MGRDVSRMLQEPAPPCVVLTDSSQLSCGGCYTGSPCTQLGAVEVGHAHKTRPALSPDRLPRSLGLFPEEDIPENAARKLQEGRRGRKNAKRLPTCQLQNKTGGPGAVGRDTLGSRCTALLPAPSGVAASHSWASRLQLRSGQPLSGPFLSLTCVSGGF